jgi:hypothetical protein
VVWWFHPGRGPKTPTALVSPRPPADIFPMPPQTKKQIPPPAGSSYRGQIISGKEERILSRVIGYSRTRAPVAL